MENAPILSFFVMVEHFPSYVKVMKGGDSLMDYVIEVRAWIEEVYEFLNNQSLRDEALVESLSILLEKTYDGTTRIEDLVDSVEKADQLLQQCMSEHRLIGERVGIGEHQLPPLSYAYNALEPYISREIMQLHHDKHHRAYVEGLNKAEKMMEKARETNDFSLIKHWEREAAFHGSGHYLHTLFWENMSPKGGGEPKGELLAQINQDFGSFQKFKKHFSEAAKQVEGVGWSLLVWVPRARRLEILQSERHMLLTQWDTIPILVLDVWEHAYYLQYKNNRANYVDNWWNVVNWPEVGQRFLKAKKLVWQPA